MQAAKGQAVKASFGKVGAAELRHPTNRRSFEQIVAMPDTCVSAAAREIIVVTSNFASPIHKAEDDHQKRCARQAATSASTARSSKEASSLHDGNGIDLTGLFALPHLNNEAAMLPRR